MVSKDRKSTALTFTIERLRSKSLRKLLRKPPNFQTLPCALLPALLLTVFMSSGSFARGFDEPPIDTFCSNDSRELNHITDLMNERGPTLWRLSGENALHQELTNCQIKCPWCWWTQLSKVTLKSLIRTLRSYDYYYWKQRQRSGYFECWCELNKLTLTKSEIVDLMASDIAKEAQETLVAIDKNALFVRWHCYVIRKWMMSVTNSSNLKTWENWAFGLSFI